MTEAAPAPRKRTKAQAEPVTEAKESVQQAKNRLRNEAERIVLNNHRAEFIEVATKLFKDAGYEFTRRKTEEERAQDKINELLAQFPALRGQVATAPVAPAVAYNPEPQRGPVEVKETVIYGQPQPNPDFVPEEGFTPPALSGADFVPHIVGDQVVAEVPVEEEEGESFYEEFLAPAEGGYEQP